MTTLRRRFGNRIKGCFGRAPSPLPSLPSTHIYVPDDILIAILVRVPGDVLLECKRVCQRWRNLISSTLFVNLHVKHFSRGEEESLFIRYLYTTDRYLVSYYVFHNDTKRLSRKLSVIEADFLGKATSWYCSLLTNSCGGLLVIKDHFCHCLRIFNPITRIVRKIDDCPTILGYSAPRLCGIYFDRFRDDYKVLSIVSNDNLTRNMPGNHMDQYFFFSLSRNVWERFYQTSSMDFRPNKLSPATIVGDVMYWIGESHLGRHCSKMVVAFDMEKEEFYCLPHPPISQGYNCDSLSCATTQERVRVTHNKMMQLIVKTEQLCFCHTLVDDRVINLWILEDNTNWESWVLKYKVHLLSIHSSFRLQECSIERVDFYLASVNIICFHESTNAIIFTWQGHELCLYNLETHKTKIFGKSVVRGANIEYVVIPYNKTILSPYLNY